MPGWDDEVDVIVVGFGGAGVCAAIEAAENGATVLAFDRFDGGGATALSGGVYYGGGTTIQRAAGFDDTAQDLEDYLKLEVGSVVRPETLHRFCRNSAANLQWLMDHGVRFDPALDDTKTGYPRKGTYLYYAGNERLPSFRKRARPAPRGHRAFHESHPNEMTGRHFFGPLRDAALAAGVRLLTHAPVTRLMTDEGGTVIGIEANRLTDDAAVAAKHRQLHRRFVPMDPRKSKVAEEIRKNCIDLERAVSFPYRVRARQGVILTTGGFVYNREMVAAYAPKYCKTIPQGSMGCDGSGILLGMSVGAAADRLARINLTHSIAPPHATLTGILVNLKGERFVSEDAYTARLGYEIAEHQDGKAWLIVDSRTLRAIARQALPSRGGAPWAWFGLPTLANIAFGGTRRARSITTLAGKLGMDPAVLDLTVRTYNAAASGERTDPMGKDEHYLRPLEKGPFYAINRDIANVLTASLAFTLGGLMVNEDNGAVLRSGGSAIDGLYAAGRAAVGLPSEFYVSGMSIADCVFSGRRAALHASAKRPG
jgi:3-oxo-5alpha-steroid 4-dehydrogenase